MSEIPPHDPPLNFEGNWLYGFLAAIFQYLKKIATGQTELETQVRANTLALASVQVTLETLAREDETDFAAIREALDKVLIFLTPPPPPPNPVASFKIEVTELKGEDDMAKAVTKIGKFKIDLNPDGTAVATLSGVVDAFGNPTTFQAPPTYVCETTPGAGQDPNVLLTPAADGLTCGIAANKVLVNGDTLTVTGDGISETYNPVNVVPGPANSFVISVT